MMRREERKKEERKQGMRREERKKGEREEGMQKEERNGRTEEGKKCRNKTGKKEMKEGRRKIK